MKFVKCSVLFTCFLGLNSLLLSTSLFADINQGLVAYYPFNGNALDESGNDNHGLSMGAVLAEDRFGIPDSAYYFDGINDTIFAINSDSLNPETAVTISAWIYLDSYPSDYVSIVNKWHSYVLQLHPDYGLCLMIFDQTSKAIMRAVPAATDFELGKWYHVAATYDEVTGLAALYINGVSVSFSPRPPYGYPENVNSSVDNLKIGSENNTQWWHGDIDDVRIYNRELADFEIIELFNDTSTYNPPAPPEPTPTVLELAVEGLEIDLETGEVKLNAQFDPNSPSLSSLLNNPDARITIELKTENMDGVESYGIKTEAVVPTETLETEQKLLFGSIQSTPEPPSDEDDGQQCDIDHDHDQHDHGKHLGHEKKNKHHQWDAKREHKSEHHSH